MKKSDWQYLVDTLLFLSITGIAFIGFLMGLFLPKGPNAQESAKYFLGLHRHQRHRLPDDHVHRPDDHAAGLPLSLPRPPDLPPPRGLLVRRILGLMLYLKENRALAVGLILLAALLLFGLGGRVVVDVSHAQPLSAPPRLAPTADHP